TTRKTQTRTNTGVQGEYGDRYCRSAPTETTMSSRSRLLSNQPEPAHDMRYVNTLNDANTPHYGNSADTSKRPMRQHASLCQFPIIRMPTRPIMAIRWIRQNASQANTPHYANSPLIRMPTRPNTADTSRRRITTICPRIQHHANSPHYALAPLLTVLFFETTMSENLETIIPEIEAMSTEVPADLELDEELKTLTKTVEVTTEIATEPVVEKEPEKQTEKEVPEKVPDKQEALETVLQVLKKYNLKYELGMILYPVFVHMYLELVYNGHEQQAIRLMNKFGKEQEIYYQGDLMKLSQVTKREHMKGNEITDTFKSNEFIIRMSRDTLATLKRHLQEKKQSIVLNIIQEHLYFDMYEGMSRNKQQIDSVAGAMIGESTRADNKTKVYYGMPKEPDYQFTAVDDDEEAEAGEGDKPKKKKAKKEPLFGKKTKSDPNAPPVDRLPLPEFSVMEPSDVDVFGGVQRARISSLGRSLFAARLLFRDGQSRQDGSALGHRSLPAAQDLRWTLFRCRCSNLRVGVFGRRAFPGIGWCRHARSHVGPGPRASPV
ncbi:unnamed protein product, partial [Nesidiocoris tenuis]